MALAAAGSYANVCSPAATCPLAHTPAATTPGQRRHPPPALSPSRAPACGAAHTAPHRQHRLAQPRASQQPLQLCLTTARRGRCRHRLSRHTIAAAFPGGSHPSARPGATASAAPNGRRRGSSGTRLAPPEASAAASGGPTGRTSPPPPGAASASGPPFNPRYSPHQHHHSQAGHRQPPPHSHAHTHPQQHPHPHPHQPGSAFRRAESAAAAAAPWATTEPLVPGGGGGGGGGSQPGDANARHEPPPSVLQPLRAGVPTSSPPSTTPTQQLEGEPWLAAAGVGVGVGAAGAGMSTAALVTAAARHRPSVPYPPHLGEQPPLPPQQEQQGQGQGGQNSLPQAREERVQVQVQLPAGGGERTQLEKLYVKDFALVSEQTVRLGPGLNVITGESGSGKSVLVEAFSQVLGAPAPQECVRAPADMAVIEGTFLVGEEQLAAVRQLLASCGLPQRVLSPLAADGGGGGGGANSSSGGGGGGGTAGQGAFRLTVRREISQAPAGGLRSRVFLNGGATSLRVLREMGALLVDSNGQHASMSLRDSTTQLDLLDRIAGTAPLADSYCAALARLRDLEGRLDELDELDDEQERATMQKLVDAVAKLRIQPGEERELRRTLKKMEARRVAVEQCGLVRMALCGEAGAGGVTDALRTIEAQLNAILALEEQNRAATAARGRKGKDGAKAADGDAAAAGGGGAGAGEDEAGEEGEEEGEEGGGAAGAAGARLMEDALEQVATAKEMLAVAETMTRAYARRYQFSQADHDATSERLARIERLMKQASAAGFGAGAGGRRGGGGGSGGSRIVSTEQLLEVAEECSSKLASYYEMEGQREDWEAQLESLVGDVRATALQLSSRRRAAAASLRGAVESCLRELAMGGSRFDVRIGWAEERVVAGAGAEGLYVGEEEAEEAGVAELGGRTYVMGPRGLDQVEFLLAAGPAEPLRPLAAVASGGESARVMLALKAAPAQAVAAAAAASGAQPQTPEGVAAPPVAGGGVPIMILDELDSGIGARLGSAVGSILARMALPTHGSNTQIICVTHLPQVACYAAHHIKVQKEVPTATATAAAAAPRQSDEGDGGAASSAASSSTAAVAAAPGRVMTTFQPLMSFQERSGEVAAMLGLDAGVAEEMLCAAQRQVAALYPPGTLPDGFLQPHQSTSTARPPSSSSSRPQDEDEQHQQWHPATAAAAAAAAPRASPPDDDDCDGPGARAAAARRVVQDALRGGGVAGGFSVVVTPAMDPNAVLVGGEGAAAAAGGDGGADGLDQDGGGGGDAAEEAELSAQLLAGVEAAAMQHLRRMEAQAKAAAAAAAAAAGAVAPPPAPAAPAAAVVVGRTQSCASAAAPPPASAAEVEDVAAEADVGTRRVGVAGDVAGGVDEAGDDGAESSTTTTCPSSSWAVGADLTAPRTMQGGTAPQPSMATAAATAAAVDLAEGTGSGGGGGWDSGLSLQSVRVSPLEASADSVGSSSSSSNSSVLERVESSGSMSPQTQLKSSSFSSPNDEDDDSGGSGSGFVVAVQPSSCSPLPYNFGGGADDGDDDGGGGADDDADAGSGGNCHDSEHSRDSGIAYDMYDMYDAEHRARQQLVEAADLDATYSGEAATWTYGTADAGDEYVYGVGGGVVGDVGGAAASPGGSFVAVPNGQEVEFEEMFQTIMSFTREDYAGEAMRSHEAVLMEALRDAGLA
ncbi:hypothetical protein PLESTF_000877600 [Pleodorina starrii]|nr:hypothetical protein PLESTF_000877600 [Pleodorina starrii]